jgi:chaperonin cofactor prefoldin
MPNLQDRAQELLNERQQLITRVAEINGALQELDRIIQTTPTEEETND